MSQHDHLSIQCNDFAETRELGLHLGKSLLPGLLIALDGTLGAGKTALVQSIAEALEIDRHQVVSPTFGLIQTYAGTLNLVHIDAYRIADEDQYLELGIDEILDGDSVVAMEWAGKFDRLLPDDRLTVGIEVVSETERILSLNWPNERGTAHAVGNRLTERLGKP